MIASPSLPCILTSARLKRVEANFLSGTLSPRSQKMQILSSDMAGCWATKVSFHSGLTKILDMSIVQYWQLIKTNFLHVCSRDYFSGANIFIIHHDCDIAIHVLFSDPNITTTQVSRDDSYVQPTCKHLDQDQKLQLKHYKIHWSNLNSINIMSKVKYNHLYL